MRVAITGHTGGLGLAFFNYFVEQGHEVLGFSKSTGFDISNPNTRIKILESIDNFDIFINNAYSGPDNYQLTLLDMVYNAWSNQSKIIINVSSRYVKDNLLYCKHKLELDNYCEKRIYDMPRIINLKPGLIDTSRVKHIKGEKMTVDLVVKILEFSLANNIHSVTFGK